MHSLLSYRINHFRVSHLLLRNVCINTGRGSCYLVYYNVQCRSAPQCRSCFLTARLSMEFWYEILSDSILGEALDVFQDQHDSNKQLDISLKKT